MKYPFVESRENLLGTGRFVELNGDRATVEYFRSPADKEFLRKEVALASLTRKNLPSETRVYWYDTSDNSWSVGRVLDYQKDGFRYLVRFPNDDSRLIPSDELQVRCRLPILEPTDHLANQLNESAFWHSARSEFVCHLLEQHRVNLGLSALVSSSVELVPHQASAIHRVLLDPFQRYLLADEVGLGKTIEACVLIKQFSLDEPHDHETLLILPDTLMIQWQQELTHRFHLGHLVDNSIHIVSNRDLVKIRQYSKSAKMIVIDEAHHISSWAWSSVPTERETFDAIRESTSDLRRRVILLSATPVLHNEKSFLAMLHLLDPHVYPLDSLNSFKERVRLRQEIAECMLSLTETESNFFLVDTLTELGNFLIGDIEFQSLRADLVKLLNEDVSESDPTRIALIRAIRTHVGDMWRLHRRILRSRRTDQTSVYFPGRGGVKQIVYYCEKELGLTETVENWRSSLSASCYSLSETQKRVANDLVRTIEELSATDPSLLYEVMGNRLSKSTGGKSEKLPLLDGEAEYIKQIMRSANECDNLAKLKELLALVGNLDNNNSFVLFTNTKQTADYVFNFLDTRLPKGKTLRHSATNQLWSHFRSSVQGYLLVCDREAEEGLNLQKRDTIVIHFDLPFSPNRVEQRMGRLDRFGQSRPVQSVVFLNKGFRVQQLWFELIDKGLGVFNRSITSLQYIIEDLLQQVWNEVLDSGAEAFEEATQRMLGDGGTVAVELKRIRAQDNLDSFDSDQLTEQIVDKLESNDQELAQISSRIFKNWVEESIRFRKDGEESNKDKVFNYKFCRRIDSGFRPYGQSTLMPQDEFENRFKHSIEILNCKSPTRFNSVPFTFDRVVSQKRETRLLRVGDPFVDAFEDYTRWDDRGVCYAFWRYCKTYKPIEDPDVFFRFDYVLSPNLTPMIDLCKKVVGSNVNSLLRRTYAIMKPHFETIWLDSNLEQVLPNDERFDPFLKTTFGKSARAWGRDFNLNSNRWKVAAKLYDMSVWRDVCYAARRKSEAILREHSKLPELTDSCVSKAKELAQGVEQQFRSRLSMACGEVLKSLQDELEFERAFLKAQIESFTQPELRPDSIGAVFLSRKMPFNEQSENRGDED